MALHNEKCFNSHMGVWCARPDVIESKVEAIRSGLMKAEEPRPNRTMRLAVLGPTSTTSRKIAIIYVDDVMMPKASKFGGCSTIEIRKQLRAARADSSVGTIVMKFDTPGGHIEGQGELVDEIEMTKREKPVYAYEGDMCCSAGQWASAVCDYVACHRMTAAANIGAFAVLHDFSKMAEMDGVRVIVVRSGPKKGLGVGGTEIDDLTIGEVQKDIDNIYGQFIQDVSAGRTEWDGVAADGSVLYGVQLVEAGLADEVTTFEDFLGRVAAGEDFKQTRREKMEKKVEEAKQEASELQSKIDSTDVLAAQVKELAEQNAALQKNMELLTSKEAAESAEAAIIEKVAVVLGFKVGSDLTPDQMVKQLSTLVKNSDQKPSVSNPTELTLGGHVNPARAMMNEYKKKFGKFKGGAMFRDAHPDLYAALQQERETAIATSGKK